MRVHSGPTMDAVHRGGAVRLEILPAFIATLPDALEYKFYSSNFPGIFQEGIILLYWCYRD